MTFASASAQPPSPQTTQAQSALAARSTLRTVFNVHPTSNAHNVLLLWCRHRIKTAARISPAGTDVKKAKNVMMATKPMVMGAAAHV